MNLKKRQNGQYTSQGSNTHCVIVTVEVMRHRHDPSSPPIRLHKINLGYRKAREAGALANEVLAELGMTLLDRGA